MYCSKCGKEMPDDAVICTGCGCLLNKRNADVFSQNEATVLFEKRLIPEKQEIQCSESIETEKIKNTKITFWCAVITIIFLSLTVVFFLIALASLEFYSINGLYRVGDDELWIEPKKLICSLICSVLSLIAAVIAFIFALKKGMSKELKLFTIFSLGMSAAFVLGILKVCTVFAW